MRIIKLNEQSRANILADLLKRDPNNYSAYEGTVQEIVTMSAQEGMKPFLSIRKNLTVQSCLRTIFA